MEFISVGYELTKYLINRFVLQEWGEDFGGCLTGKNQWGLLTGDDGVVRMTSGSRGKENPPA